MVTDLLHRSRARPENRRDNPCVWECGRVVHECHDLVGSRDKFGMVSAVGEGNPRRLQGSRVVLTPLTNYDLGQLEKRISPFIGNDQ